MTGISKFDAADYLTTPEAIAAYLSEAFKIDDPKYIRIALENVARADGRDDFPDKSDRRWTESRLIDPQTKRPRQKPGPFAIDAALKYQRE